VPKRESSSVGSPVWVDLFTTDTDKSRAFYEQLFGWTSESAGEEYGGYINFSKDGMPVAGCMRNGQSGGPDVWSVYLETDDAKATVEAAVTSGAQVLVDAMSVMELGTMAVVLDPGGASIGLWQAGLHTGFGVVGEPGAPSWFELHTRAYDAAVEFYRHVFKWDAHAMSDTPEFRYTTLGEGETARAGIMDAAGFLPEGVPSYWAVYFGVDDADKASAAIVDLGGAVVEAAQDTPYGRMATATDPTGARFKIVANIS
jgi:uncharacterized protein